LLGIKFIDSNNNILLACGFIDDPYHRLAHEIREVVLAEGERLIEFKVWRQRRQEGASL